MANYEELRKRKVEENQRKIEELKLTHLSISLKDSSPKPSPTKKVKRSLPPKEGETVVLRRSGRVANLPETSYKEMAVYFEEKPRARRSLSLQVHSLFLMYISDGRLNINMTVGTELIANSDCPFRGSYNQRRLMDRVYASDEAREYATERAEELNDKLEPGFPSFVKPMTQSHVTGGFWLGLPKYFCTKHLPKKDTHITLIDETGDESETLYLANKNGLSAGWRGFSIDHGLVDGDSLVFQLVRHDAFKVYIIRVRDYDAE